MNKRTLVLHIAVPDFYTSDLTQEQADEFFEGNFEDMLEASLSIATQEVSFELEIGGEKGSDMVTVEGRVVGAEIRGSS